MTSKHTPGPWEISAEDSTEQWTVVTDKNSHTVANVNWEGAPIPEFALVTRKMPMRANAKLIAAAPELLEAAKRALELIRQLDIDNGGNDFTETNELRAAIAKAEGE